MLFMESTKTIRVEQPEDTVFFYKFSIYEIFMKLVKNVKSLRNLLFKSLIIFNLLYAKNAFPHFYLKIM